MNKITDFRVKRLRSSLLIKPLLCRLFAALLLCLGHPQLASAVEFQLGTVMQLGGAGVGDSIVAGDFGGDDNTDVMVAPVRPEGGPVTENGINILLGDGKGGAPTVTTVDWFPLAPISNLASADLNKDLKADLVITEMFDSKLSPLTCDGSYNQVPVILGANNIGGALPPAFDRSNCLQVPMYSDTASGIMWEPGAAALGDFDEDGDNDAVVMNYARGTPGVHDNAYFFANTGGGKFAPGIGVSIAPKVVRLVSADINRDGHLDIVTHSSVFLGVGNGAFTKVNNGSFDPNKFAVGDIDGDGYLDRALISDVAGMKVSVQRGDGNGSFNLQAVTDLGTGSGPADVQISDLDGDGRGDIVIANGLDSTLSIYYSIGLDASNKLAFSTLQTISTQVSIGNNRSTNTPTALLVTDWNADGCQDLLVPSRNQDNSSGVPQDGAVVVFLRSNCPGVIAKDDYYRLAQDTSLNIPILANDLAGTAVIDPTSITVTRTPKYGSFDATTMQYKPYTDYVGEDNFSYKVNTLATPTVITSNVATVTLTVIPKNQAPVALADVAVTTQNCPTRINVAANDTDPDAGDSVNPASVTPLIIEQPSGDAKLSLNTSLAGVLDFQPNPSFTDGVQRYYYVLDNGKPPRASNLVEITVNIDTTNVAPIAVDDTASTNSNIPVEIDVLANDSDPTSVNSGLNTSSVSVIIQPGRGRASVNSATARITFTPPLNTTGTFSFTYTVKDKDCVESNPATVRVEVTAVAGTLPEIVTHPQAVGVFEGETATFSVVVRGDSTAFRYQWHKKVNATDETIPLATLSSYTTPPVTITDDDAKYYVIVSNDFGAVSSIDATLAVTPEPPTITTQPVSRSVPDGDSVTFSVVAESSVPLTYQWQHGSTAITGATTPSLTIAVARFADSGNYTVLVSNNAGGSTLSDVASLTVIPVAPSISLQPAPQKVTDGQPASFSVVADGSAPLTYQWRRNGAAITNANAPTYVLDSANYSDYIGNIDNYSFDVVISNDAGNVTSTAVTLTVSPIAPTIVTHPQSRSVLENATASFSVTARGSEPLSYKWRRNGVNIPGATLATYTTSATTVLDDNGATFDVHVSNSPDSFVVSDAATLRVSQTVIAPAISTHLVSQIIVENNPVIFSVVASGTDALTYKWFFKASGADSVTELVGATSVYMISAVTPANAGVYSVQITNAAGIATSEALLTVTPVPGNGQDPVIGKGEEQVVDEKKRKWYEFGATSGGEMLLMYLLGTGILLRRRTRRVV